MMILLYDNGTRVKVLIPDDEIPLHQLAKDGKIQVVEEE